MNQPYFATSVRDFWANRWNLIVQRCLRRIVFDPVMGLFGIRYPLKKGQKVANWKLLLAVFSTFLFSALMHEWTMVAIMERSTTWEQMSFFILHGVLAIVESIARKVVLNITGIDLSKSIPHFVQVLYAQVVMVWTAPLFLNPYIREQLYFKYSFI
jgi:D-alanyl-lipoteichoic acid acyltransferase DltB (MBOAT superfamily)